MALPSEAGSLVSVLAAHASRHTQTRPRTDESGGAERASLEVASDFKRTTKHSDFTRVQAPVDTTRAAGMYQSTTSRACLPRPTRLAASGGPSAPRPPRAT